MQTLSPPPPPPTPQLLVSLKTQYITEDWLGDTGLEDSAAELTHAVLMTLRLLLRDEKFQVSSCGEA